MPNFAQRANTPTRSLAITVAFGLAVTALWWVDPRVGRLWLNTAELAGLACLVALPLGILISVLIFKTNAPGRGLAVLLLVGMLFVPLYLVTGAWDAGFGIQGWHTLTTNPHLAHQPWLAGWRAAVWVHGLAAVPWVVLIVGAGLRAVEPEIEEDAATCTSPLAVLWHVSLRRAAPAIAVAAVWIVTIVMTEISVTDFFQVRTFAEEVYTQSALGIFDATGASDTGAPSTDTFPALGLWSGLVLAAALALVVIVGLKRFFADLADAQQRAPWSWRLKAGRLPATVLLWSCMLLLAGVPLGNLVYKAGIQVTATESGRVREWSPLKLVERLAAAPGDFRGELWLSAWLGVAAATTAIAVALPLAWSLRGTVAKSSTPQTIREVPGAERSAAPVTTTLGRCPSHLMLYAQSLKLLMISLCLTIPGPLLGLALIRLMNRPPDSPLAALAWLYDSNFAPWLVQTIRALPIATLILWPALASVPQVMLDNAAVDGTGWWRRLLLIAAPQRWPAIIAAWLIALAIAVGELAATILVMPPQPGATALSIQVFQLLHYGVDDRVAAICLVMVFGIAALTGIAAALLRRKAIGC